MKNLRTSSRSLISLITALCLAGGVLAPALIPTIAAARIADDAATYKKLAEQVGPALVTVKFIMKLDGAGSERFGEGGREVETSGVVIDPTGLVLVSNAKMGGLATRMGLSANPTDIKILAGEDNEGVKARILARDSDLDLCWVLIDDDKAKGKSFAAIDLASPASTNIGDRLLFVDRMGKFFDHAVIVDEGRVGGMTKKPRNLIIPVNAGGRSGSGAGDNLMGMPMFSGDGKVVGINVLQLPAKEDAEGGEQAQNSFAILILPAAEVVKATSEAKKRAAEAPAVAPVATPATTEAGKPAEGEKPMTAPAPK